MRQDILNRIKAKYGSFEEPTFYFIDKALKSSPYKSVIEKLKENLSIEDHTDTNYQICFEYALVGKKHEYHLELSFVDAFGVLVRFGEGKLLDKLLNDSMETDQEEKAIKRMLQENGIELLSGNELVEKIPLKINVQNIYGDEKHQPKEVVLYHALFSADRPVPWAR